MSTFDSDAYRWRETYFVLFEAPRRPKMQDVQQTLRRLSDRFQLTQETASDTGDFESLTLLAPDDYAALDITYLSGEDVLMQGAALVQDLEESGADVQDQAKIRRLAQCDARLDIMHFEQVVELDGDPETDDMLDPSALLVVMQSLVKLTGGIGVDPQSGVFL
jgi:hypothetical protein